MISPSSIKDNLMIADSVLDKSDLHYEVRILEKRIAHVENK